MKPKKQKKPRWKSQRAHRDAEGQGCPCCGEKHDLCYDSIEIEGGGAYQGAHCYKCGASWGDCYDLTGYVKTGEPE